MRENTFIIRVDKLNPTKYDPNIEKIINDLINIFEEHYQIKEPSNQYAYDYYKELAYNVDFCVNEIHSQEVNTAFHWLFYKVFVEICYDPNKRQDYVKMMKRITKQFIKTIILGEVNTTGKAIEFHCHSDDGKIKIAKTFYFKPQDLKERIFQPEIRCGIIYATMYHELAKLNYLNQDTFNKIYI